MHDTHTTRGDHGLLFVGNVPFDASEWELHAFLDALIPTTVVGIPRDPSGHGKGVAYVRVKPGVDVAAAIARLNGIVFQGRALRVSRARPRGTP